MKKSEGLKAADLKTKTEDELKDVLLDLKKQQFNLRLQLSQGQLANSAQVKIVRRAIARVNALVGNKQKGTAPAAAAKKTVSKPKAKKAAA